MSFKDWAVTDLSTFFSLDEFADVHNIDGVEMTAVIDKDVLMERARKSSADLYHATDGVYVDQVFLFVRKSDLQDRPVNGQSMRVDGEIYLVLDCAENFGVFEITLEANRA